MNFKRRFFLGKINNQRKPKNNKAVFLSLLI